MPTRGSKRRWRRPSGCRCRVERPALRHRRDAPRRASRPGRAAGGAHAAARAGRGGRAGARARGRVGAADRDRERASRTARSSTGRPGRGRRRWRGSPRRGPRGPSRRSRRSTPGKAEIRAVIERARERRRASGRPTILFLDEIHRFNKAQQDALLPAVEEGLLTLIGATTENPYFEVNSALLSRAQVYELRPLEPEQVEELLRRALARPRARHRRPAAGRRRGAGDAGASAAAATPGSRSRRSSGRSSAAGGRARSTSPRSRTRCSARRSTTTARATATTTSSRPGSRRPAAPTSTPRSTTWR